MENKALATRQELALDNMADLATFGKVMVTSGMFPDLKSEAQAIVKIIAGRELGFPPLYSLQHVNVIQGKTGIDAGAMAALVKRSGRYDYRVVDLTDQTCIIQMYEDGKPLGQHVGFTMEDARKAGLAERDMWKKYPRNMLFARAISNAARWYAPHVIGGAYIAEELGGRVTEADLEALPTEAPAPRLQPAAPVEDTPEDAMVDGPEDVPPPPAKQSTHDLAWDRYLALTERARAWNTEHPDRRVSFGMVDGLATTGEIVSAGKALKARLEEAQAPAKQPVEVE